MPEPDFEPLYTTDEMRAAESRHPDLSELMERAGATPERTLMVGDSRIDYETARNADVRCCLVSYGFSGHTFADIPVGDAWIVEDTTSLGAVIGRFMGVRSTV